MNALDNAKEARATDMLLNYEVRGAWGRVGGPRRGGGGCCLGLKVPVWAGDLLAQPSLPPSAVLKTPSKPST